MPDLIFTNEKSSRFHNVTTENKLMRLSKNGDVYTSMRISVVMSSMMRLENFPMDAQTLYMQLECFTMPETDIKLSWSPKDPFQFNPQLTLPDFDFDKKKITLTKCDKSYETGTYSCIEAKFPLRRLLGFYMIGIYIPTGLAVVLSYLSFWIDPKNAPARICIGIFANLTVNKMTVADKNLPRVSYVKALDIWLFACQLLTFVALVEYAVVNVQLRMEVEDRARLKKLQEEADERCQKEAEEEDETLDDTTLWLMDMVGVRPESTRRKATPIEIKVTDAENIDRKFRKIFPAACGLFNVIYWGYCLNQN